MGVKGEGIRGDMKIGEVVSRHPETIPVFLEHGLHCIGCRVAITESIAEGARAHGMDGPALAEFMRALNAAVKKDGR